MDRSPTIAILDDDDGVRTSLVSLVRSLGYDVRSYSSALAFLNDQDIEDPDCMIADIQMPQITGDQLQTLLIAAGRIFPMIFMTAFPTEATRSRVMAAGGCGYLGKPVDGDTVARCLKVAIEHRRASKAPSPRA